MKLAYAFIAIVAVIAMIAVPVSASTVQIATGDMNKVSQSVQVSGNFNMDGKNVYQQADATMGKSRKSIQGSVNVNVGGKQVE